MGYPDTLLTGLLAERQVDMKYSTSDRAVLIVKRQEFLTRAIDNEQSVHEAFRAFIGWVQEHVQLTGKEQAELERQLEKCNADEQKEAWVE